jgi:hypothetical protein
VLAGDRNREEALACYGAFSDGHARAFRRALRLQRLIPALPPRVLTGLLRVMGTQRVVDRAFGWYLDQAHPDYAGLRAQPMYEAEVSRDSSMTRSRAASG